MPHLTDVQLSFTGRAARITLDRPRAMNALTFEMITSLDAALDAVLADDRAQVVFLDGAGERGFCAGGDIIALRASVLAGDGRAREFWATEYALNLRLSTFPRPIVAFMDGVVMGGGIGLGGHVSHRVVTERVVCAMPEVGIGFYPDVGGTWLLSRSPGELGTHLALTGDRVGAADAILVGFADHQVPSSSREALFADLAAGGNADAAVAAHRVPHDPPPLAQQRHWIDAAYVGDDAAELVRRLGARPESAATADTILSKSPTSVSVTLAALRRARELPDLAACLEAELALSTALIGQPDFPEGVRAQVVDKDRNPRWSPATLAEVAVERFFSRG